MKKTLLAIALALSLTIVFGARTAISHSGPNAIFTAEVAEVDRLAGEQKLQAALDKLQELSKNASYKESDFLRAEFLIRATKLRIGLHGYETAVRDLKSETWPKSPEGRILVELYYAHALMAYSQIYSWEIRGREKSVGQDKVDLRAWTTEQIGNEIGKSFDAILSRAENKRALDKAPPAIYGEHLVKNSFPQGVRPSLRDAVMYLAVDHLRNSQYWTPEQSANSYLVKLDKTTEGFTKRIPAADEKTHPLVKIASWLGELRDFHARSGNQGAVLETRYVLYEAFHGAQSDTIDRRTIRLKLETTQKSNQSHSWWSRGQALLADMTLQSGMPNARVEARKMALAGFQKYPSSYGGKACEAIVQEIERPEFQVLAMSADLQASNAPKKSILVNFKNLKRIYFRAFRQDVELAFRQKFSGGDPLLNSEKLKKIQDGKEKPIAEWDVMLEPTSDYSSHRKLIAPQLPGPGTYIIEASARPDFSSSDNVVVHFAHMNTNLILSLKGGDKERIEARVLSGDSGIPVVQAEVRLYRYRWDQAPEVVETKPTDAKGYVSFAEPRRLGSGYWNYFLSAKKGAHEAYLRDGVGFRKARRSSERRETLVYTDRSIYRPNQKIFFKTVTYMGDTLKANLQTVKAGESISVQLKDPNGQIVAVKALNVNQFGTASGEFTIPGGRPLGSWTLEVPGRYFGHSQFRVEEYKRPTFETIISDSAKPLRLNQLATIKGEAKYYFGLPVSNGIVRWRVTRSPVTPHWWSYYGWSWWIPPTPTQTIASGESSMRADGTFEITFQPTADERIAADSKRSKDISYNFSIEANVTDEGGETRSGEKTIRIGFQSLEARIQLANQFSMVNEKVVASILVSNITGKPRAASGSYTIHRLRQPAEAPLPADLPRDASLFADRDPLADPKLVNHSDDETRSRWETNARWEAVASRWPDGDLIRSQNLKTDTDGVAKIEFDGFKESGVYKIMFECKDDFGNPVSVSRHILVAEEKKPQLQLPIVLLSDKSSYEVGETAKILIHSGLKSQRLTFEIFRDGSLLRREEIEIGKSAPVISIPISSSDRGGLTLQLSGLRDHQKLNQELNLEVYWTDRELEVKYSTFRDKIRPGSNESFRVTVIKDKRLPVGKGEAEVLAYMYDRSLDLFGAHQYRTISSLYPSRIGSVSSQLSLSHVYGYLSRGSFPVINRPSMPMADSLSFYENYGVGGPGGRAHRALKLSEQASSVASDALEEDMSDSSAAPAVRTMGMKNSDATGEPTSGGSHAKRAERENSPVQIRSEFSETAFFRPHLVTDENGSVGFEFQVPDSVTSWQVYAHALTKDLRGGVIAREAKSVKELMVRTYAPRFLREGDEAEIKVAIGNASQISLGGELSFELEDPQTGKSVLREFGLKEKDIKRTFQVSGNATTTMSFSLKAPKAVGQYAFKVVAVSKQSGVTYSDGERKPFPVLPSRVHLAQSRFVTLKNKSNKNLIFEDLAKSQDPTLISEKLVVTVDAQLFYGVLRALPYLANYPYESTEQTLNRFVSAGILTSLFKKYPSIKKMASEMSKRKERFERFDEPDANRRMSLEESPWLQEAQGNSSANNDALVNVLDSRIAASERERALAKLKKMQLPSGAFPWFEGGPADRYMTLYMLLGFGRALEFQVDIPKEVVVKAWSSVRSWLDSDLDQMMRDDCCHEFITLLNFAISQYPDASWSGGLFDEAYRKRLLEYSFGKWKRHSPLLKGYLALTLKRLKRDSDAKLVWDSVMDSAKSNDEQGTFWAQEDRSWLWYNDTIETHAFGIRTLLELDPKNTKLDGLVQWLFLNKKLNHWKSTRATAESIYSLAHFLDKTATLATKEEVQVDLGNQKASFVFEPDRYTGSKNQIVVAGDKVIPKHHSSIKVSKSSPGFAFASAVWHFSTDELPKEDRGDFFQVSRRYFKRENNGKEWLLKPISDGVQIRVGEQIEVQISIRLKHAAEYVHLRDPRAAGFEPENVRSGYRYETGISWFEETRDSGTNFFFSSLPVGEYTFRYRLRANMAGSFRVGPATIQSIYAPEFNAYSNGSKLKVYGSAQP